MIVFHLALRGTIHDCDSACRTCLVCAGQIGGRRRLLLMHHLLLLDIVRLRLWHPTEPTRIELFTMVLLSLRMMLLMLLESRIVKAIGLIHDDLIVAIALISVVQSRISRIICHICIPVRAAVDCYLLLRLLGIEIVPLRWGLTFRKTATFDPTRTEVTPVRQILKAHSALLLLLLILCHVLDIYRR